MSFDRKITVSADTSQLDSAFERAGKSMSNSMGSVSDAIDKIDRDAGAAVNGINAKIQEMERETDLLFKSMLSNAQDFGKSAQDRAQFLEKEIKLISQAAQEDEKRSKIIAQMKYSSTVQGGGDTKQAKAEFMKEMSAIEAQSQMADLQKGILQRKAQEQKDASDGGGDEEGKKGGGTTKIVQAPVSWGRQAFNAALGAAGFGAILSIGGFVGKMIQEGAELQSAQAKAGAMGLASVGGIQGLKTADILEYARRAAPEIGYGGGAGGAEAAAQGRLEKGMGMELGTVTMFNSVLRSEEHNKTLSQATKEMAAIMSESGLYDIGKGDFTLMHELLGKQNQLNELQASKLEQINVTSSSQALASFAVLGGSFKDKRATNTISNINQAITDPSNDFKRAFLMRTIQGQDPNSSLLDVEMAMEQGVFKPGQMQAIMSNLSKSFQGDMLTKSIASMFNLNLSQAKTMQTGFSSNPNMFANIGSAQDYLGKAEHQSLYGQLSGGGVSTLEDLLVRFNNKFADWGDAAIKKIDEYVTAYDKGGFGGLLAKMGSDIASAIGNAVEAAMDKALTAMGIIDPPLPATYEEFLASDKARNEEAKRLAGYSKFSASEKMAWDEAFEKTRPTEGVYKGMKEKGYRMHSAEQEMEEMMKWVKRERDYPGSTAKKHANMTSYIFKGIGAPKGLDVESGDYGDLPSSYKQDLMRERREFENAVKSDPKIADEFTKALKENTVTMQNLNQVFKTKDEREYAQALLAAQAFYSGKPMAEMGQLNYSTVSE